MGIERFGRVGYTQQSKAEDYVTYLEQGKVMATRCKQCGTAYFPPKMDCPKCLQSDVEWFEVKGKVKLVTYTIVHYGPAGFENDTPYVLGIVSFGDGLRAFGRLSKDINPDDIKVGMELEIVPLKLPDDRITHEFKK